MKRETSGRSLGDRALSRGRNSSYHLRMARGIDDVRAAQTLRFLVFNVELNEGLEQSFVTCRDADPFDEICDHLLVEDLGTHEIVGTYRLQTGLTAASRRGYYSAQEFDLTPLEHIRSVTVELGRACVHSAHRNFGVLGLLWRGIIDYARNRDSRYLIGCSSLPTQDPRVGASAYSELIRRHFAGPEFRVAPHPHLACPLTEMSGEKQKIPKLLRAYLSLGATICGPPALDREFKTVDFLTLLDVRSLPENFVARCHPGAA